MIVSTLTAFAAAPPPVPFSGPADGDPVRIAFVGALPDDDRSVREAVLALDPDLVVYTGLDARHPTWPGDHATMAMADGNPRGRFLKRFEGIGTDGRTTPYGTVDFVVGDKRWRTLYATTWGEPIGRFNEQQYWTPRAADPEGYDRLILLLDSPAFTASEQAGQSGARVVLDDVQDVTKPIAMPLVVAGNTATNETFLPGGPFGELHLVAGNSGVEPAGELPVGLNQRPDPAPGFAEATGSISTAGFWIAELHGGNVDVRFFQQADDGSHAEAWRLLRDGSGWHPPR